MARTSLWETTESWQKKVGAEYLMLFGRHGRYGGGGGWLWGRIVFGHEDSHRLGVCETTTAVLVIYVYACPKFLNLLLKSLSVVMIRVTGWVGKKRVRLTK